MSFLISIPVPPSSNNLFANGRRGRFKTAEYKSWIDEAGWTVKAQKPTPVKGPYKLFITVPKIRGDLGNREKAVSDLLVSLGLIDDDRHAVAINLLVAPELNGHAVVSVEEV